MQAQLVITNGTYTKGSQLNQGRIIAKEPCQTLGTGKRRNIIVLGQLGQLGGHGKVAVLTVVEATRILLASFLLNGP